MCLKSKAKKASLTAGAVAVVAGSYTFGQRSENHLSTLCPAPVQLARCMIQKTPHDFGIIQSFRSSEDQRKLYQIGRRGIEGEKKVTWTLNSNHMSGRAFDIMVYLDSGHSWEPDYYKEINEKAAKLCSIELGIPYTWGGTFKNSSGKLVGDWGHFETHDCVVERKSFDA